MVSKARTITGKENASVETEAPVSSKTTPHAAGKAAADSRWQWTAVLALGSCLAAWNAAPRSANLCDGATY